MPAGTMRYGKKTFRLVQKTRLKSNANKKAKSIRDKGLTARIAKIGKGYGVFRGARSKN